MSLSKLLPYCHHTEPFLLRRRRMRLMRLIVHRRTITKSDLFLAVAAPAAYQFPPGASSFFRPSSSSYYWCHSHHRCCSLSTSSSSTSTTQQPQQQRQPQQQEDTTCDRHVHRPAFQRYLGELAQRTKPRAQRRKEAKEAAEKRKRENGEEDAPKLPFAKSRKKLKEFLNVKKHPLLKGRYFPQIKRHLENFKLNRISDAEAVNLSIRIVERMMKTVKHNSPNMSWMKHPSFFNPLWNNWKDAAVVRMVNKGGDGEGEQQQQQQQQPPSSSVVPKARELLDTLLGIQKEMHNFHLDYNTIAIIMEVLIHEKSPSEAPVAAEELLDLSKELAVNTRYRRLFPNTYLYNLVLQSYAQSGLPPDQVSEGMASVLRKMRWDNVRLSNYSYVVLLGYWREQQNGVMVEKVLENMRRDEIWRPSVEKLLEKEKETKNKLLLVRDGGDGSSSSSSSSTGSGSGNRQLLLGSNNRLIGGVFMFEPGQFAKKGDEADSQSKEQDARQAREKEEDQSEDEEDDEDDSESEEEDDDESQSDSDDEE